MNNSWWSTQWEPAQTAQMLMMLEQGMNARDVAYMLSKKFKKTVTKNAVIGKMWRDYGGVNAFLAEVRR